MRCVYRGLFISAILAAGVSAANGQQLTQESFERIRKAIDVTPDELRWQKVEWKSYWDGLTEAQKLDRPIFYWIYFGDPRSGC